MCTSRSEWSVETVSNHMHYMRVNPYLVTEIVRSCTTADLRASVELGVAPGDFASVSSDHGMSEDREKERADATYTYPLN